MCNTKEPGAHKDPASKDITVQDLMDMGFVNLLGLPQSENPPDLADSLFCQAVELAQVRREKPDEIMKSLIKAKKLADEYRKTVPVKKE